MIESGMSLEAVHEIHKKNDDNIQCPIDDKENTERLMI